MISVTKLFSTLLAIRSGRTPFGRIQPGRSTCVRTATFLLALSVGACGGDDYQPEYDQDYTIAGIGLDGPLTHAHVAVYALLDNATHQVVYQVDEPGLPVLEGTTDANARIVDMLLEDGVNPPYILAFTATDNSIDLTTGAAPVITEVRTLVTEAMLEAEAPLYASPLTTLSIDMALRAIEPGATLEQFNTALTQATSRVVSTLGFGMESSLDIFLTPPVLGSEVDVQDSAGVEQVLFYRSAIEATRVLVEQLGEMVGAEGDNVLDVLGQDLADGSIDGQVDGERAAIYASDDLVTSSLALFDQTPSALCVIPGEDDECLTTVADLNDLIVAERSKIGVTGGTVPDIDPVTIEAPRLDVDSDDDGVNNDRDAFPDDPEETVDTDADGVGDNGDNCAAIANPGQGDADDDGIGDACDDVTNTLPDGDDDGVPDASDNCPSVANANQLNTDSDSQGNACDADDDNDGTADGSDAFPLDADETADTDEDGVGDNGDNCPLTSNANQLNTDGDENGNVCDLDDDNDTVADTDDNCPVTANADQANFDEDSQGDACDTDDDNDGLSDADEEERQSLPQNPDTDGDSYLDGADNCPIDYSEDLTDTDNDDYGDICDTDDDGDGDADDSDNCPLISNADQLDTDSDGFGNVCDDDDDEDGVSDVDDAFPLNAGESVDTDSDTVGDNSDNCVDISNTNQLDTDGDTAGNVCDDDDDGDGLPDADEIGYGSNPLLVDSDADTVEDPYDNCIAAANTGQDDLDGDGAGDACDTDDDGDGLTDAQELVLGSNRLSADTDEDGFIDGEDNCVLVFNDDQADTDEDGRGDACE